MRLYLVRHAQTAWNAAGRAQGHADEPLDDVGRAQIESLAQAFSRTEVCEVLSSDLSRSLQTAQTVADATGARLCVDPALRETQLGDWEGKLFDDLVLVRRSQAGPGDPYLVDVRAPRGESVRDVWNRLAPFASNLDARSEPTAVVIHGGAGALLLARLLRANIETAASFQFGNASITELARRHDGRWSLVRLSDASHLNGAPGLSGSLDGSRR